MIAGSNLNVLNLFNGPQDRSKEPRYRADNYCGGVFLHLFLEEQKVEMPTFDDYYKMASTKIPGHA